MSRTLRHAELPQRFDVILAFKAIGQCQELNANQKRVAIAIVDSFNRTTGRCDPSYDRLSHLLGIDRRTVIRAVRRLEHHRFIIKIRHGGHFHCNAYQPNWALFRDIENRWKQTMKTSHRSRTNLSLLSVTDRSHLAGDNADTQTIPCNQSLLTSALQPADARRSRVELAAAATGHPSRNGAAPRARSSTASWARAAALRAAERRWSEQLHVGLKDDVDLYARVIAAIDEGLRGVATEAEMAKVGSGMDTIIKELKQRGVKL